MLKSDLRKFYRKQRAQISREAAAQWSNEMAQDLLAKLRAANFDGVIFLFAPMQGEPDLLRVLMHHRYHLALPRSGPNGQMTFHLWFPPDPLIQGSLGILEPQAQAPEVFPASGDVAVIPALAVDEDGCRLGFGGGYYDRWLAEYRPLFRFVAVAIFPPFISQSKLPKDPHDVAVDFCLKTDRSV